MSDTIVSPKKIDLSSWIILYNTDIFQNAFSIPQYAAKHKLKFIGQTGAHISLYVHIHGCPVQTGARALKKQ
jgi:hypothetical protein